MLTENAVSDEFVDLAFVITLRLENFSGVLAEAWWVALDTLFEIPVFDRKSQRVHLADIRVVY